MLRVTSCVLRDMRDVEHKILDNRIGEFSNNKK